MNNNKSSLFNASSIVKTEKGKVEVSASADATKPIEDYDDFYDEEDELYRPMKTNRRKSMAPLFVYLLLKKCSSKNSPLRQQDIIDKLKKYPYEISIERKALSRIIHNLVDSDLDIHTSPKKGTWYEETDW